VVRPCLPLTLVVKNQPIYVDCKYFITITTEKYRQFRLEKLFTIVKSEKISYEFWNWHYSIFHLIYFSRPIERLTQERDKNNVWLPWQRNPNGYFYFKLSFAAAILGIYTAFQTHENLIACLLLYIYFLFKVLAQMCFGLAIQMTRDFKSSNF
jgi:hypothetical protein